MSSVTWRVRCERWCIVGINEYSASLSIDQTTQCFPRPVNSLTMYYRSRSYVSAEQQQGPDARTTERMHGHNIKKTMPLTDGECVGIASYWGAKKSAASAS